MSSVRLNSKAAEVAPCGNATRDRLVASALKLFGERGYHGVGAREIAREAGTPLSAIPYHFGTKENLYRAAFYRVRQGMGAALAPAFIQATQTLAGPSAGARAGLLKFQGALLDVLAGNPDSEGWAKLLLREHLDPGPAFDLAYEDAAKGAVDMMAALIGRLDNRDPASPDVLLEAFACMGQVLVFRTVQAAVIRRLGWRSFEDSERAAVVAAIGRLRLA